MTLFDTSQVMGKSCISDSSKAGSDGTKFVCQCFGLQVFTGVQLATGAGKRISVLWSHSFPLRSFGVRQVQTVTNRVEYSLSSFPGGGVTILIVFPFLIVLTLLEGIASSRIFVSSQEYSYLLTCRSQTFSVTSKSESSGMTLSAVSPLRSF